MKLKKKGSFIFQSIACLFSPNFKLHFRLFQNFSSGLKAKEYIHQSGIFYLKNFKKSKANECQIVKYLSSILDALTEACYSFTGEG